MKRTDFDFFLPPGHIAQHPLPQRDAARLWFAGGDYQVRDLPLLLKAGDLLVVNNSKVIPARLLGKRGAMQVEVLLHRLLADTRWEALARPLKRLRVGEVICFGSDFNAEIIKISEGMLELRFAGDATTMHANIHRYGAMPLPPYIKPDAETLAEAKARYQTVYAAAEGSVAAPTAGLHFTPALLARLAAGGVDHVAVTLHVGAGTFQPVKAENIADHVMHAERAELSAATAARINQTRARGGRIVAVGTTALRVLETAASSSGGQLAAWQGDTRIFITPGYHFKLVDVLLTNFHLPQSTLFMLVCAFIGIQAAKNTYNEAIARGYRFYSYGDACLFERDLKAFV